MPHPLPSPGARALAAAAALLTLAGCAGVAGLTEVNKRLPGTIAAGALTPGRPAAAQFGPDASYRCPVNAAATEAYAKVEATAKASDSPLPVADGQLCALAEALLGWEDDQAVPPSVSAFLAQYFGLASPVASIMVKTIMTASDGEPGKAKIEDPRQIGGSLADSVIAYGLKVPSPRYGLATMRLGTNRTKAVLVLQNGLVALDPLPRRLEAGQKAAVTGALTGELENPKLLISDAQGRLTTLEQPPGRAFKGEVACDRPGRIVVEVRGEEMGNERVLATVPVACGLPLATSAPVAEPAWPTEPAALEKKMAGLIDAERAAAGLPALTWSEPVEKIARALSEAMRDGAKGGVTAVPVNIVQRLGEADIQAPVILQNPAAAVGADQAHDRLLASPSHRANVMSTEVTHGGLGVAVGTDASGRSITYLTQLFIRIQPPPDVPAMKQAIRDAIAKKRAADKQAALTADAGLEKLANEYAAAVAAAGGPPPKATTEQLNRALQKAYKNINLLVDARLDPSDFAEDSDALGTGRLLGLGGALGRHPRLGKNTLFVVLIVANKLGK
ncbi:MAG: CAP domain-containing protein [Anaeromyxobacter sp.]|nr:CAP domain-containing protein [Anaeromyxobacter sp.]MBL0275330.1 CAP domain-containing protein [Anaeromyxobacter sp.]